MDDSKSQVTYFSNNNQMMCQDGQVKCTNVYSVVDEHTIRVKVPEQASATAGGQKVSHQPFNILMMDMDGEFVNNQIKLYYFIEFTFKNISAQFAYSNEEKPIMIETDFHWDSGNDY